MWNLKRMIQMNFLNRKRLTDLEIKGLPKGRMGEGTVSEFGMDHTLLCLKWIANKDLLYNTRNSAQCYVAVWMGGGVWGEWIHVHVWLGPFAIHLRLPQH